MDEMKTYSCTVLYDASAGMDVQASSPDEAAEMAESELGSSPGLCHQCASHLDTGDSLGVLVYDEAGEMVLDTTMLGDVGKALQVAKARIAELEAELLRESAVAKSAKRK